MNEKKIFGQKGSPVTHSNTRTEFSKRELRELSEVELRKYYDLMREIGNRSARRMIEVVMREKGYI